MSWKVHQGPDLCTGQLDGLRKDAHGRTDTMQVRSANAVVEWSLCSRDHHPNQVVQLHSNFSAADEETFEETFEEA